MKRSALLIISIFFSCSPHTFAAGNFEVSGWIPYWRTATGTTEALAHLSTFKEINPFGYTVTSDGHLYDAMDVTSAEWQKLFAAARAKKVRVIPTVMWGNGNAIHAVLSNKALRDAHIKEIVAMVRENNFDGVDIDYEAKLAETKDYYSIFLRDLYKAIGNKFVQCEVESRTPVNSRYFNVPSTFDPKDVANDYKAINKYCDRVRIMAYDQGRVDQRLDQSNPGIYAPVADPQWVNKVVALAALDISKSKIILGIPTYGYEYAITAGGVGGYSYERLWAFNPLYALQIAAPLNIMPTRTSAGELSFNYYPDASSTPWNGLRADLKTNTMVWSDAIAIKQKVDLAKKLGLKGVAVFKIDGGVDPLAWNYLK
ncbi:MAG: glycosyl hydrolase family 18 protein [Patescibacteria group bacterium]